MSTKRILSLLISVFMVFNIFGGPASAANIETNAITVYISISKYGDFANDKNSNITVTLPIELNGQEYYTLDDAFRTVHDLYYEGGSSEGYASGEGQYGLAVDKFWGDSSGLFGYQVNNGSETVTGLSHRIENGDYIDAYILQNSYPNTEAYAKFNKSKAEVYVNSDVELILTEAGYDESWNTVFSGCTDAFITVNGCRTEYKTGTDGKVTLKFDSAGEYIVSASKSKIVDGQNNTAITAPVCIVTVKDYPDACITVPDDVHLYVGFKGKIHFVNFTEVEPSVISHDEVAGIKNYYFDLNDGSTYNYRISSDKYITYAGKFTKTAEFNLNITEDMLQIYGKDKTTIDRDTSSNNSYNVADIYLNINPQGYLRLDNPGDTYQLVNLRNWEAVDSVINNYFIEPDYHYTVINEDGEVSNDVLTVSDSGLITAVGTGTSIVLVTYDAINIPSAAGGPFFGAIWPENTGVFVVSVGAGDSGIITGMTINESKNTDTIKLAGDYIDAEHDIIYFIGDSGSYTFTPEDIGCSVSVANPTVDTVMKFSGFVNVKMRDNGSFTVPLREGRNIVKIEKDGKTEYQVITAKKVTVTVNNGEAIHPGDTVSIVFDTLYHPANKLAGVYNMNALPVYTYVSGYENRFAGGLPSQYNFANNSNTQNVTNLLKKNTVWGQNTYVKDSDLTVPLDYVYDTFTLSDGMIYVTGFGDSYGNHRGITLDNGKAPNMTAEAKSAWLGKLPEIKIPITATDAGLSSIVLDTSNVKKDYYVGDIFDATNLIVTANYDDAKTQVISNYTIFPEVMSEDTDYVTITYRGKNAYIAVDVTVPEATAIEVTTLPLKTTYTEGETFDPTGMVISLVYSNGQKTAITDYSYSPNRELRKSDAQMTISYFGADTGGEVMSDAVPITVNSSSHGGSIPSSNTITVYFTLMGDGKHGELTDKASKHTMNSGNLDTWISITAVTVDNSSYVIDAVTKALSIAGIPYNNIDGNYISSIRGLSEFDNGALSGWMYTLNGKYPKLGVSEQTLKNGDKIVFHYTDDYTQEQDYTSTSSGNSGSSSDITYTVRFETNGGNTVENQKVSKNGTVIQPPVPQKNGYVFVGWFTDEKFTNRYNFETRVTGSFTLFAKWTENKNEEDQQKLEFSESIFIDVKKGDWYYEPVKYVYEYNLMKGTNKGFEPESKMTRAMLVAILYRMENSPKVVETSKFTDVEDGQWYSDAVVWAGENAIVKGISNTHFAPDEEINREQMALIIYRYASFKGYNTKNFSDLSQFSDKSDISEWAEEAIKWAHAAEIIKGTSESSAAPRDFATRAQAAVVLMRFCEHYTK